LIDVATAGEREALAGGHGMRDGLGAGVEGFEFEHAHGPVPDHGGGLAHDGGERNQAQASPVHPLFSSRSWGDELDRAVERFRSSVLRG
jgi:hypothetical protein